MCFQVSFSLNKTGKQHTIFCKQEFDNITCWPDSLPGEFVSVNCPAYMKDFNPEGQLFEKTTVVNKNLTVCFILCKKKDTNVKKIQRTRRESVTWTEIGN